MTKWIKYVAMVSLALCLTLSAQAGEWLKPGDPVTLGSDEGLALIFIDSDSDIDELYLDRDHGLVDARIPRLGKGRYMRLLKLKQGTYRFRSIRVWQWYSTLTWKFAEDMTKSGFTVEPGKTNYIGDLISRGYSYRTLMVDNRAANALIEMEGQFPGVLEQYPFRYAGPVADPFVPEYLAKRSKLEGGQVPASDSEQPPAPSIAERDAANMLFRPFEVQSVRMAPEGDYFFEYRLQGLVHQLVAVRAADLRELLVFTGSRAPKDLEWIDHRQVVVTALENGNTNRSFLVTLPEGNEPIRSQPIRAIGMVLSATATPGEVLFVGTGAAPYDGLFRVKLQDLFSDQPLKKAKRLYRRYRGAWWADASGEVRLNSYVEEGELKYRYFHPDGQISEFAIEQKPHVEEYVVGFDRNGRILAISNRDRTQRDLVALDATTGKIAATIYSEPGVDVREVLYGFRREVSGVRLLRSGRLEMKPLNQAEASVTEALGKALPNRSLAVFDAARNGARLVLTSTNVDPGTWYLFNVAEKRLEPISRAAPALEGRVLAGTRRILAKAKDGFEIETFLTELPSKHAETKPLLVIVHGGPVGGFDMTRFDPEVQYFAQLGYAVLQVNYRGSGNSSIANRKGGFGNVGKAIESDIDAAVDHVLQETTIDPKRIAVMGSNYGGYSAVMLTMRKPERYLAAVSISGISDLPLLYSSGADANRELSRLAMKDWLGDPGTALASLVERSPSHHAEQITRPLMIVHDRNDDRTAFEHARRLQMALRLVRRPANLVVVDDHQNGLFEPATQQNVYPQIAAFLRQQLESSGQVSKP